VAAIECSVVRECRNSYKRIVILVSSVFVSLLNLYGRAKDLVARLHMNVVVYTAFYGLA